MRKNVHSAPITRRSALALTTISSAFALSPRAQANPANLYTQIAALDQRNAGLLSVSLFDNRSKNWMSYNGGLRTECASIVKALILGTVCFQAQTARRSLTTWEKRTATCMIQVSDNDSATALWNSVGGAGSVAAFAARVGMTQTLVTHSWGLTRTSSYDQVLLLNEYCWGGRVLAASYRSFIMGLMGSVTPSQRWGVGSYGLNHIKNGWLPYAGSWRINSIGHVGGAGTRNYTLAILQQTPTEGGGINIANQVALTCYNALATAL